MVLFLRRTLTNTLQGPESSLPILMSQLTGIIIDRHGWGLVGVQIVQVSSQTPRRPPVQTEHLHGAEILPFARLSHWISLATGFYYMWHVRGTSKDVG